MKQIVKAVQNLAERSQRLEQIYKEELEAELGKEIIISDLGGYENTEVDDYFFKIMSKNNDIGVIFPFRRLAYIKYGRENGIKEVLERRGYAVSIESISISPLGYIHDFQRYSGTE